MNPILECALFFAGLAFGSFLNVCISRIPRDLSIVSPSSFCPQCRTPILRRDNVPVLSWILLRGRCRACGKPISLRYPVVELLTAGLFVGCYVAFGTTWLTLKTCVFCFLTVGLIFMDSETGLLVHEFTYPGIVTGVLLSGFASIDPNGTALLLRALGMHIIPRGPQLWLLDSIAGAAFGAGFFYLTWALYYLVRRRHGMGFGDIALIAMSGAFLGLKLTVLVVFFAPIMATVFAVVMLFVNPPSEASPASRDPEDTTKMSPVKTLLSREVPFGVYLGTSSLVVLFCEKQIWNWYLELFH